VAVTRFALDGAGATEFLARWIGDLRFASALHAVVLGGITIAGLGLVDLTALSDRLALPVLAATRRDTSTHALAEALRAAGLADRLALLDRAPPAYRLEDGLYVACAGTDAPTAERLIRATLNKALLPEPLRLAHLIGAALVRGASRGRV
jgi:endonuclease V-like protein UPF0215 family